MDLIVFGVGFLVSVLVVYGIFVQVVAEMSDAYDAAGENTFKPGTGESQKNKR